MPRAIAITGLGAVSGLGVGITPLWEGLCAGQSALGPMEAFDPSGFDCRLGGHASAFKARDWAPKSYRKAVRLMARDIELAVGAAQLAVEDAGMVTRHMEGEPTCPGDRLGCHIGAGLIATEANELASALSTAADADGSGFSWTRWGTEEEGEGAMGNLPPLWMLKYLPNMLSCHVTIIHGAEGPSNTHTNAEASGLLSLGEAARVIERDQADVCLAGSAESKINLVGWARMSKADRLAPTGDTTDGAEVVRPFDPDAPGELLGEAGGILIVEEAQAARARGARVYAEIAGFGAGQSAGALLPPWPTFDETPASEGLVSAIDSALRDAGIGADEIDAIVPQGVGSTHADAGEARALRAVFGDRLSEIPLITWTPNIGGCLAGNGGVQAAIAAKAVAEGVLPARVHRGQPMDGLCAESAASEKRPLRFVLACASAYGGPCAALIVRAAD
ncbi:MAG: beta-ketoacyl synthase N-terminal-like domain-containing protein [Planctomycetota bacterium]